MIKSIKISGKIIAPNKPCFIIAEAGVNHNGSLKLAKKLVDEAKKVGADAVKFQTFKTQELVTKNAKQAKYQEKNSPAKSQYEMLKKLELSDTEFKRLLEHCKRKKIIFLSTPFDFGSVKFLYKLGVPAFKIASGDLTNIPLLVHIAQYNKSVILSTGMSTLKEVRDAVNVIYLAGNKKLVLLHCTSNYPTKFEDVNLKAMQTLMKRFQVPVGYSDHTEGIEVAIAAVSLGACVIEKHFTLNKNLPGPDHKASLEPEIFRQMVKAIRNVEKALGNDIKKPTVSEVKIKNVVRKSLVAKKFIPKGEKIKSDMLAIKRPGKGIKPEYVNKIIGWVSRRDIKKDSLIRWKMINK